MASLAESVIGGAQQQAQNAGRSVGDAVQAYHVVATAEHARQELDMEKQRQTVSTANWIAQQYDKIGRTVGPAQGLLIDSFGKQMQQIQPGFNPQILDVLKKDPDAVRAMAYQAGQALSRGSLQNPAAAQSLLDLHNGDLDGYTGSVTKMGEEQGKIQAAQLGMAQVRGQMLEETKRQHGLAFNEKAALDPIIVAATKNTNSLIRSEHILNDPNLPVTAKDLNLAYQDYSSAVNQGGAATEGQIHRDLPDTWEQNKNELLQKVGLTTDLRKTKAGLALIEQLRGRITGVKEDLGNASEGRAEVFHNMGINSGNPYVTEAAKQLLMQHAPNRYMQIYGAKKGAVAQTPAPQAPAPAADWSHVNDAVIDSLFEQHVGKKQVGGN